MSIVKIINILLFSQNNVRMDLSSILKNKFSLRQLHKQFSFYSMIIFHLPTSFYKEGRKCLILSSEDLRKMVDII